jgi:hypothetical protein
LSPSAAPEERFSISQFSRLDPLRAAETISAIRDAGLFRVLQPANYGGFGGTLPDMIDVAYEIGRGSSAAAWIFGNVSLHSWIIGMFDHYLVVPASRVYSQAGARWLYDWRSLAVRQRRRPHPMDGPGCDASGRRRVEAAGLCAGATQRLRDP